MTDSKPKATPIVQQPINGQKSGLLLKRSNVKAIIGWTGAVLGAIIAGVGIASVIWYNVQLAPKSSDKQLSTVVTIDSGMTPNAIGKLLQDKGLIRSGFVFEMYARLSGVQNKLQAGTYRLLPSDSTPQIVGNLSDGNVASLTITFYPGATLEEHKKVLLDAGFDEQEIDVAFAKTYDSPLFATKPPGADLEGYIYGETYKFDTNVTVETVLRRMFDEFNTVVIANDLVAGFQSQGLSLYEGITLASVIQREVSSPADQKQVAQVFFKRLNSGIQLGSDVTYQYIADKLGVPRDPNLDNPYNTRRYTGLPPGPISSPGLNALLAVTNPTPGDYTYFLSGDDGITYFSNTEAEHNMNVLEHCQVNCSSL